MRYVLALACLMTAARAPAAEDDVTALLRQLHSRDRVARIAAAEALATSATLPESAAKPIVEFIKTEVEYAALPQDSSGPLDKNIFTIPADPDAVSFARIKADPGKYSGREFTLVGGLRMSDYYSSGYKDATGTHYAFDFQEMKSDGTVMGPFVPIYALRLLATSLAERATVVEEQKSASLAIRLRCTIEPERLQGDPSGALETIEAKDWSFFSPRLGKWLPWSYHGVRLGWALLFKTGKEARNECLDLIVADSDFQGEKADTILRGTAIAVLLKLPKIDRQAVYKSLPARAKKAKSPRARAWAGKAYKSLSAGKLVL